MLTPYMTDHDLEYDQMRCPELMVTVVQEVIGRDE
jgi:hypothetical protein